MRPPLPLPSDDDAHRVHGVLLLNTGDDKDVWEDVLSRLGELPGMQGPGYETTPETAPGTVPATVPATAPDSGPRTAAARRLVVAHDPAWRGATAEEVAAALDRPGVWRPDLVVLTDERTGWNPETRPLLALRGGDAFWITPRQVAMTYLVLNRSCLSFTLDHFAERAPADLEYELEEGEELEEEDLYEPVGVALERLSAPPRYTRPPRALPVLEQDVDLLVRTDFADDAAWSALVAQVRHPKGADVIDDYGDYLRFVDDPAFAGATPEQVMAQIRPREDEAGPVSDVVLIADAVTLSAPGNRLLAVPLADDIGLTFPVDPEQAGTMMVNLAISNQGIEDWRKDDVLA